MLEKTGQLFVKRWFQEEHCDCLPGQGAVDQLYTLAMLLEGEWVFAHPVYMCFIDMEKVYDHVTEVILWRVLREYGVDGFFLRVSRFLHCLSQSLVRFAGRLIPS